MKKLILMLVLISMIIPTMGSLQGAYWKNNYLFDQNGVPILSANANNYIQSHTGIGVEVTTTPGQIVNKKTGKITYSPSTVYRFGYFPKDFDTRKETSAKPTLGLSGPVINPDGVNANAYILMGRKWNTSAVGFKKVVMSLKNDAVFNSTGLSKTSALSAIAINERVWDDATTSRPFSGSAVTTTTANWKYDGVNNMAFTPYVAGCTALAATGVWYKTQGIPAGQMYPIVESDMTFNSNMKWTATGEAGKLDFQSVALHEMGHTLGLGDLYGRPQFSTDTRQVMHYYTGVKRTLGNGDATGVWRLYG